MMRARRSGGFTLIEILVVVAIIVVMVGLAGAQLMRGPVDVVREESEHLALLLRAAREEAILQGRVFAFGAGASPTASCVWSATVASRSRAATSCCVPAHAAGHRD